MVAARVDGRTGRKGIKVLAQHHCIPPPGEGEVDVWGKAVRKRFRGVVKGMKKEVEERRYEKERREGYERSGKEDREREEREKRERERKEREEIERLKREVEIKERRARYEAELPPEPERGEDGWCMVSVAKDGVRKKRAWLKGRDTKEELMKWVDVEFEVEWEGWDLRKMDGGEVEGLEEGGTMMGLRLVEKEVKEGEEGEGGE